MSSGVGVADDCVTTYNELKLKKLHKYILFGLAADKDKNLQIVPIGKSDEKDYDKFLEQLKDDQPCWAVYDFEYTKGEGKRNKLTFISWSPDTASVRLKMVYASSRDALRRALIGIAAEIQATDITEVAHEIVLERVSRGA